MALVGQVGLAAAPGRRVASGSTSARRRRVSRQAKRTTSTGRRKCSPSRSTFFGVSATTTNRRAAEITIFSRRSAPPPPLIRRSSRVDLVGSVEGQVELHRAVQLDHLDAQRARQRLGARRGRGGPQAAFGADRRPARRARPSSSTSPTPRGPSRARWSCRARPARPPRWRPRSCDIRWLARRPATYWLSSAFSSIERHAAQRLRDRAALLGASAMRWNSSSSMPGTRRAGVQFDAGDLEAAVDLSTCTVAVVSTDSASCPASAELARQRHREAAGVSGGDQLLGVGALASSKRDSKRVRALVGAAGHPHRPVAALQRAVPRASAFRFGISQPPDRVVKGGTLPLHFLLPNVSR